MSRKCLFLVLTLILALLITGAALADIDDPVKISMELSTNKFSEPGPVTVSITLSNVGDGDLPGPITLYYPSGKMVEEFGSPTLAVGASKNWSGTWKVTQAELDAGKLTFSCKFSVYNEDGELVNKHKRFSKKIIYSGADPVIDIQRTVMPSMATKGQEVTVNYDIQNTGTVEVTSVTIKENSSISAKSGTIEKIPVGETGHFTFTTKMGNKDLTSQATVTYKAGGKSYSKKVEAATVQYGEVKLSANLEADKKGGSIGDTIKLTLGLKNTGTVDFTGVTVTDPTLGEVFTDVEVPAGKTVTLDKEITLTGNTDLQFTINATNSSGSKVETATGRVSLSAIDPTQKVVLTVEAEADRDVVYKLPGTVRFLITVQNDSTTEVRNIAVKAVDTTIYTIDSLKAGESLSFARDMDVSMAGTFQFTANCKDVLGQTQKFTSNAIPISYAPPTPEPTEAPLVTPPAPVTEPIPEGQKEPEWLETAENIAGTAKWVLAGIGGVLFCMLLIGAIRRGRNKSHSNKAMDHLEGAVYRDYSTAPRGGRRSEITDNTKPEQETPANVKETEGTAQNSELMAETLRKLYSEQKPAEAEIQEAAPVQTPAPETTAANEPAPGAEQQASPRRRSRKS